MIINVNSAVGLQYALDAAKGGETILLAQGNYGVLEVKGWHDGTHQYDTAVTIRSASDAPGEQAVFDGMLLSRVEGLNIENVTFDYDARPGAAINEKLATIADSANVSVTGATFIGDLAEGVDAVSNGYATGTGLHVTDSSNITVSDNDFSVFQRGATFWRTEDLTVTDNHVHAMRSDGFNFADVDSVLIEGNHFESFVAALDSADHRDFLQFWTSSTTSPSTDVVIRGNMFDIADGNWTQSIFMRNELVDKGIAGSEMFYSNFLIEDNVIRNGQSHGIAIGETDGLVIRNNTVIDSFGEKTTGDEPVIRVAEDSVNVTISGNIAHAIHAPDEAKIFDNILIDPDDTEALTQTFANPLNPEVSAHEALMIQTHNLQQTDVGAAQLYYAEEGQKAVMIEHEAGTGLKMAEIALSIEDILDDTGSIGTAGIAQVVWSFGDGTTASGMEITHGYANGGLYNLSAEITLESGETLLVQRLLKVDSPVAHADKLDALSDLADYQITGSVELAKEGGVTLKEGTLRTETDASYIGNSAYTVSVDFKLDETPDAGGRMINYTGSFHLQAEGDALSAAIVTDLGVEWIRVKDVDITHDVWHSLTLTFSSETGTAELSFNGEVVGKVDGLKGAIQTGNADQDFIIGSPSNPFTGQIDNVVFLRDNVTDAQLDAFKNNEGLVDVGRAAQELVDTSYDFKLLKTAETKLEPPIEDPVDAIIVSDAAALKSALSTATGGETILLESGVYDRVVMRDLTNFSEQVTLRSLDVEDQAIINFLFTDNAISVTFDSLTFGGTGAGAMPVQLNESENLQFVNTLFKDYDPYDNSVALSIKDSDGISVTSSIFEGHERKILARDSNDTEILFNTFIGTKRDGLTFVNSDDIEIIGNTFDSINTLLHSSLLRFDNTNDSDVMDTIIISQNALSESAHHPNIDDFSFNSKALDSFDNVSITENSFFGDILDINTISDFHEMRLAENPFLADTLL